MRVVVTGGAGFIGANLCRTLIDDSSIDSVVAFDDLSTGLASNLEGMGNVELVVGSILDEAQLEAVVSGADSIVHLAARPSVPRSIVDPMASHEVNATGTMRVLESSRRGGGIHVVVASSSSVYGANPQIPKREDMATMPASPYAASKLATEAYTLAYGRSFGLPVLAFRFFNVFGPLQTAGHAYAAVIPTFIDFGLRGEPLPIHGDGKQTRDFTYVGTVARVLAESVIRKVTDPEPINLAFGSRVSLLELVELLEVEIGKPLQRRHEESRQGDIKDSQADQQRLMMKFPDVVPVDLEEGLRATVRWFTSSTS